ncbi:hypothetical protein FB451DRAFT_1167136 [Mycena latifolia]|nr:hypothetical protein FB451DRAFT_1167136 [Mycena latifolia]
MNSFSSQPLQVFQPETPSRTFTGWYYPPGILHVFLQCIYSRMLHPEHSLHEISPNPWSEFPPGYFSVGSYNAGGLQLPGGEHGVTGRASGLTQLCSSWTRDATRLLMEVWVWVARKARPNKPLPPSRSLSGLSPKTTNAHLCAWIHDEEGCVFKWVPRAREEGTSPQKEIHIDIHARPRPAHSDFAYNDDGGGITHITADHPGREGVGALPGAPKPCRNSARPPPHLRSRTTSAQATSSARSRPTLCTRAGMPGGTQGAQSSLLSFSFAANADSLWREVGCAQQEHAIQDPRTARARTGVQAACGARSALRARLSFRVAPIPPPGQTIIVYARALLERAAPASYMLRHAIEFAVPAALTSHAGTAKVAFVRAEAAFDTRTTPAHTSVMEIGPESGGRVRKSRGEGGGVFAMWLGEYGPRHTNRHMPYARAGTPREYTGRCGVWGGPELKPPSGVHGTGRARSTQSRPVGTAPTCAGQSCQISAVHPAPLTARTTARVRWVLELTKSAVRSVFGHMATAPARRLVRAPLSNYFYVLSKLYTGQKI